jgi:hypothetical protein
MRARCCFDYSLGLTELADRDLQPLPHLTTTMAPIRRYLRITKFSVLEVRIYLDNPSLASSWLLHPRNPVLPRVIESVRPLVLPKLKEENARDRSKAKGRKKGVKDVVVEGMWLAILSGKATVMGLIKSSTTRLTNADR